jgi:phosphatidylethanolamine/phosphatidyl-N-methylethanolamine N-methyltransferase
MMRRASISSRERPRKAHSSRRMPNGAKIVPAPGRAGSRLRFLGEFVRQPLTVGAFWPSSKSLSRLVVGSCAIKPGDTVVELGPGTGAFTELILDRLRGQSRFLAVELNASNVATLRRRFPRTHIVHDSAQNLTEHLGRGRADCVISGLAWGNMLPRTQHGIFKAILRSLAPGGQFVAFAYLHAVWFPTSVRFRRRLLRVFKRVETTPIVWRNLPPAFVYRCWRD